MAIGYAVNSICHTGLYFLYFLYWYNLKNEVHFLSFDLISQVEIKVKQVRWGWGGWESKSVYLWLPKSSVLMGKQGPTHLNDSAAAQLWGKNT